MRRLACLLVLVACGDDGSRHIMDAPLSQGDAPLPIDAPVMPVTVTFTRDGAPVADTRVYFQNADSSVANTLMTDATGTASSVVGTDGSVTLVDLASGKTPTNLTTWVAVKPGDHLLLASNAPPVATMGIKAPVDPAMVNIAGSYSLYATCVAGAPNAYTVSVITGSGGPTTVTFGAVYFNGCATTDLLVVANDSTTGEPVSYFYLPAQTVTDNTVLDLTQAEQTYLATAAHSYHITGFANQGTLEIIDQQATTHGPLYSHITYQPGDPITPTVNLPTVTGGQRIMQLDDTTTNLTRRHYFEWGGTLDPYTTDYAAHLLPAFTGLQAIDPATHILSWAQSGGSVQSDFSVAYFNVNGTTSFQWVVVGPGPSATIQLPTIPTDIADFNVSATTTVFYGNLFIGKVPGGYDAARAVVFAIGGFQDFVKSSSGSAIVNELYQILAKPAPAAPPGHPVATTTRPGVLTRRTRL